MDFSHRLLPPIPLPPKQQKRRRSTDCVLAGHQDKISELPDHILISILERMDLRSAVETSLLSRRWRHLWNSLTNLELHANTMLSEKQISYVHRSISRCYPSRSKKFVENIKEVATRQCQMRLFSKFVGGLLRPKSHIRKLSFHFYMRKGYRKVIDLWLDKAIKRGVQELKLFPFVSRRDKGYIFPWRLFSNGRGSSLTKLELGYCRLGDVFFFRRFASISVLSFKMMAISREAVEDIITNCHNLKSLYLLKCHSISYLRICSQNTRLKDLVVHHCPFIGKIELSAPKLERLQYSGNYVPLLFLSVPCLEHVWLDYDDDDDDDDDDVGIDYVLKRLSTELPCTRNLALRLRSPKLTAPVLPRLFSNLKNLTMNILTGDTDDLLWLAMLLDTAPLLETFETDIKFREKYRNDEAISWKPSDMQHSHLKEVKLHRFQGRPCEIAFLKFLLAKVVELRSMIVTRGSMSPRVGWSWEHAESSECWTEADKSTLLKQLTTEGMSSIAHFVLFL